MLVVGVVASIPAAMSPWEIDEHFREKEDD